MVLHEYYFENMQKQGTGDATGGANTCFQMYKLFPGSTNGKDCLHKAAQTFEAMERAVSEVLDHLDEYREELATLMLDEFHIIEKSEIPLQYQGVA